MCRFVTAGRSKFVSKTVEAHNQDVNFNKVTDMKKMFLSIAVLAMLCSCAGESGKTEQTSADTATVATQQVANEQAAPVAKETTEEHGAEVAVLTDKAQLTATDKPVVVDFGATWCGPCQKFKPNFAAVAKKYADKANFVYVDVDKWQDLAAEFGAQSIPTVVIVKTDGKKVTKTGYMTEEEFAAFVNSNL